jgi:redox-sensitive bicupin YhaK (pirin superfamily)
VSHASQPVLVELQLEAGSSLDLSGERQADADRGALCIEGALQPRQSELGPSQLAVLRPGARVQLTAQSAVRAFLPEGRLPVTTSWNLEFVALPR